MSITLATNRGARWTRLFSLMALGGCAGDSPAAPPRPVPVASVTVTPPLTALIVGADQQFVAMPRDANGNVLADRTIAWSTSDTTRARVSASGVVTGLADGTVRITAASEGQRGNADAVVVTLPVASVALSPLSATLRIGATQRFVAQPLSNTGFALPGTRHISWSSSDTTTARVDAQGEVTAIAAGSARITATCEGQSATAQITIMP